MKLALILTISLVFVGLVGCTEKGQPYNVQTGDQRQSDGRTYDSNPTASVTSTEASGWIKQFNQSQNPIQDVLAKIAARVLNKTRILDNASLTSRSVMDELLVFNNLILKSLKLNSQSNDLQVILTQYDNALDTGCGTLKDSCVGLKYFRLAGNSFEVIREIAKMRPARRAHLIRAALVIKGEHWDRELMQMLVTTGLTNNDQDRDLLATAINQTDNQVTDSSVARQFLDSIQTWKNFDVLTKTFGGSTRQALFSMIKKANYFQDQQGHINPDFQALMNLQTQDQNGLQVRIQNLSTSGTVNVTSMGLSAVPKYDALMFILERLERLQLSPSEASTLALSLNLNVTQVRTTIQDYYRTRFILAAQDANTEFAKLFKATVETKDLLFYAIDHSSSVRNIWSQFKSSTQPLPVFSEQTLRAMNVDQTQIYDFLKLFNSVDRSINFVSDYPHTLTMFYMLGRGTPFSLRMPAGPELTTSDLVAFLFSGRLPPIMDYSDDKSALNSYQVLYAFDMALKTGLTSTLKIDVDDMVYQIMLKSAAPHIDYINKSLAAIDDRFSKTDSYKDLLGACREFSDKNKALVPRTIYLGELIYSPYYGHLLEDASKSVSDGGSESADRPGGLAQTSMGVRYTDSIYSEMIERTRLDLGTTIHIGEGLQTAYVAYLASIGTPADTIRIKTQKTVQYLNSLRAKRDEVLSRSKGWWDKIGNCYWQIPSRHMQTSLQVVGYEREYFKQVHRLMVQLRQNPSVAARAQVNSQIQFAGLPSDFKGYDQISETGYIYNQVDMLLRVAGYLNKGLKTSTAQLPAIAPHVTVYLGKTLTFDTPIVQNSGRGNIPFVESEDEFVDSAIRFLFNEQRGPATRLNNWYALLDEPMLQWEDTEKMLISLNRLENEVRGKNQDFTPQMIRDSHEAALAYTHFDKPTFELFNLLGKTQKVTQGMFAFILGTANDSYTILSDRWGLYDLPMILSIRDELGSKYDDFIHGAPSTGQISMRQNYKTAATQYFQARSSVNRGTTVIPFGSELDRYLDRSIGYYVRAELYGISLLKNDLIQYTNQLSTLPSSQRPYADISTTMTIRDPMLNGFIGDGYETSKKQFHRQTGGCFASLELCEDFRSSK